MIDFIIYWGRAIFIIISALAIIIQLFGIVKDHKNIRKIDYIALIYFSFAILFASL